MRKYWVLTMILIINNGNCAINNVCPTFEDYSTISDNPKCWYDVAADSNAATIIVSNGYPLEIHRIATSDGYIITLFRIPNNHYQDSFKQEPVLLVHGFLLSGASFIGLGNQSLGLTLADAGHDVWISNLRGTEYSLGHIRFIYHSNEFWNFSVDEMGLIDTRLQLKYISDKTGHGGNIIYIGHSLGSTTALMYGSTYPQEVRKMVRLFIMLSPTGRLGNTKSIGYRLLSPFLVRLVQHTELAKLLAPDGLTRILQKVCQSNVSLMKTCITVLNWFVLGPQVKTDPSTVPILLNQFPAGSAFKVLLHLSETITELRAYNYDVENIRYYGQLRPPVYNVSRIDVPIYLVSSRGDWLTTTEDSEILFDELSLSAQRYGKYEITENGFNHLDFLFNRNAKALLYNGLLNLIDRSRNL